MFTEEERKVLICKLVSWGVIVDGCLIWARARSSAGYGYISHKRQMYRVHRLIWILANRPITANEIIMHKCDNPPCFLLDHLRIGTYRDNNHDTMAKGRRVHVYGEMNGKLRESDVLRIRELIIKGNLTQMEIAAQFGISETTIRDIKEGRSWTHLQ